MDTKTLFDVLDPKVKGVINLAKILGEKNYCLDFNRVFQIWDSKNANKPDYTFPNETLTIEKQYGKKLSIDEVPYYFRSNEQESIINKLKNIPDENDVFETIHGDYWIYIDAQRNAQKGHEWFFCNRKLSDFFKQLKKQNRQVILVGGAAGECLLDVYKAMRIFDINVMYNSKYVYSAKGCNFPDIKKEDKEDKEE